jgi:hypothetical protein
MSDHWIYYPCTMGEHSASIFYDHGIRESLNAVAPRQLLKVRVAFKHPNPNGFPTNEEFTDLMALEDGLQSLVQEQESLYVGRVTVDKVRHFYIYTADSKDIWSPQLEALAKTLGYHLEFDLESDESHDGYWQDLYPSDDDWQVILDISVLETLEKKGDDGTASRQIDHWAYFPSRYSAEQFAAWAQQRGYVSITVNPADNGKFGVCFSHQGTVRLSDITSHSIALRRKATELEGDYDGWESPVCEPSA